MRAERFAITDRISSILEPPLPDKASNCGVTTKDNRIFLEAVLWRVRVDGPWRELPPGFNNWNNVFRRFRRWAMDGVFDPIFEAVSDDTDFEYVLIDGMIVSMHQKTSAAKGGLKTGHRPVKRRPDHENPRPDGCAWQACALFLVA